MVDAMPPQHAQGLGNLTESEKETLSCLLQGHDAKSAARELGLSVHTINERLRDARRKLGVTSSREAARLLAKAEQTSTKLFGNENIGVATPKTTACDATLKTQRQALPMPAWVSGGILIMPFVVAALALSLVFRESSSNSSAVTAGVSSIAATASEPQATDAARNWIALLDAGRWDQSWRDAAPLFKAGTTAAQWSAAIQPIRQPLGAVNSRSIQSVTRAGVLPGAPAGDYVIVQFATNFAHKTGAIETVTVARTGVDWKLAGYFIR